MKNIFISLLKISATNTDELINRIDEVKNDVRNTLDHIRSIRSTIPKLSEKILKITESNNFVVETKVRKAFTIRAKRVEVIKLKNIKFYFLGKTEGI